MDRGEDKENSNISNPPDRLVQMTGEHHTQDSRLILNVDKQIWQRPLIQFANILLASTLRQSRSSHAI
jgi:hypothetical protein